MKRTKSLFALLAAAVLALALVPGVAFGANDDIANYTTTGQSGVLGTTKGTITLQNAKANETYKVYRLFELASFDDEDPATGQHDPNDQAEAYSYVIAKTEPNVASWYTFLTTYGPSGSSDNNKYAILSNADGAASNTSAYFIIDSDSVIIKGEDGTTDKIYYCIRKNPNNSTFNNTYDDTSVLNDGTVRDTSGSNVNEPTTPHGPGDTEDYANEAGYSAVQNFAQEALKYAASKSLSAVATVTPTTNGSSQLIANAPLGYYLVGTTMGTLASLDTANPNISIYEKNDEPEIDKKVLKKGATIPSTLTTNYLIGTGVADGDWCADTDADIGDYVQFRTVITAQQGADRYKLHDVMEDGFTFVNGKVSTSTITDRYNAEIAAAANKDYSVKVYLVTNETTPKMYILEQNIAVNSGAAKNNWTLNYVGDGDTTDDPSDGCDFELSINDWGGKDAGNDKVTLAAYEVGSAASTANEIDIKDGDKIVVTYWARLDEDAVIFNRGTVETNGTDATVATDQNTVTITSQPKKDKNTDQRNTNSTILTYGDNGYTAWRTSTVSTFQFDVVKTNEYNGTTTHLLKDAKFSLYKATTLGSDATEFDEQINGNKYNKGANALVFATKADNVYSFAGDAVTTAGSGQVNQLTSASDHEIHLEGLEAGTYLLYEDVAPKGYNKLSHPILITIQNGNYTGTATNDEGMISSVFTNNAGTATTTPSSGFAAWDATVVPVTGGASTYTTTNNGGIQIVNQTGQELPSTGGLGTKAFYAIGGSLFAASVIFLTTKKRLKQAA